MKPEDGFVVGRLKSIIYATKGLWILITTEHSFMFHGSLSVILLVVGYINNLTLTQWGFQILAIGLVMVAEALNTAIEKIADYVEPNHHKVVETVKDVGAGAVLVALIAEVAIVALIYVPKYW